MTPMQALTAAIQAGHRPSASETASMLYELQAAFGGWTEALWMNQSPESLADEIISAQKCTDSPVGLGVVGSLKQLVAQVEGGLFDHIAADHPASAVIPAREALARLEGSFFGQALARPLFDLRAFPSIREAA